MELNLSIAEWYTFKCERHYEISKKIVLKLDKIL